MSRWKNIALLIGLVLAARLSFAQNNVEIDLTMWTTGEHILWDGDTVRYYGFAAGFLQSPVFPGPILYMEEGDTVKLKVRNQSQGAPHTIHLHGLDVDQANDGVPNTSFVIHHLQDTFYTFVAPHPGTYLYHCHVASVIHVQMGMYGNIIVRPKGSSDHAWTGGPHFHQEYNWLISEFDKSWHDTIPVHHDHAQDSTYELFQIPPFAPDYFMVNGLSRQDLADSSTAINGQGGEDIYLRLSNVGFYMNKISFPAALNAEIISSDGRPLPNSLNRDTLWLMPGERYGVMLHPMTEFDDSIAVAYVNMNNYQVWNTEKVPVSIQGFIGVAPEAENAPDFTVFPNPNAGEFWMQWNGEGVETADVVLRDITGREMYRDEWQNIAPGAVKQLTPGGLANGLYLLEVRTGRRRSVRKLLIDR